MRDAARAIDALRRGWPIRVTAGDGKLDLLAVETADEPRFAEFDASGKADLLISPERAATLKLVNQRAAASNGAVRLEHVPWLDLPTAIALADPSRDLAAPLKGPFQAIDTAAPLAAAAALRLARLAGLLPAFFVAATAAVPAVTVDAQAIADYDSPTGLVIAARARLPIAAAEQTDIVAFRSRDDAIEHVALVIGAPSGQPPLVRVHSECLTGDVLGSLKCDCGPQLHAALDAIRADGWGILIYLRQEGRGIGLINKLRAYALQDQGFDTVDANLRLGFAVDERDFAVAARMLALLGIDRVRLLTNNPAKVEGLADAGVTVDVRVPLAIPANPHNVDYLATKRDRTRHHL
jgi:GTP cyclohydrolase II